MKDLLLLKEKIEEIVVCASSEALKKITVYEKEGECNIVTSADLNIQKFLHENLAPLIENASFLGEENLNEKNSDYVWIIDPIDGTANFSRNIDVCAISVALAYQNTVIVGVVYNPFTKDLYSAVKGHGATLKNNPISVSNKTFSQGLFCTAMSLYNKNFAPVCFDIISDVYKDCNDIRRFGSCAMELCYLASGKCDLYFEIRVFPWDYAAGYLILTEAGGKLTALNGEALTLDKPTALIGANNKENFDKLNERIKRHLLVLPYDEKL